MVGDLITKEDDMWKYLFVGLFVATVGFIAYAITPPSVVTNEPVCESEPIDDYILYED